MQESNQSKLVKKGDLFLVGKHKLKCGDALNSKAIRKMMKNKKTKNIFKDPSYNIFYSNYKRR